MIDQRGVRQDREPLANPSRTAAASASAPTLGVYAEADRRIPPGYDPDLYRIRHSVAHIMAQAVRDRFASDGNIHLGIGPPIEEGFYYDFELPRPVVPEDLVWIESRVKQIAGEHLAFHGREVTADEARELFRDEPYKLELIADLLARRTDEDGNPLTEGDAVRLTVYQHGDFVDLCRGPHVRSTDEIDSAAIKLLTTAAVHWHGDAARPMLQRIYGTAWRTAAELDRYLWQRAEAVGRDHRRLGAELELFHLDPSAPGMPYWLPKGWRVYRELLAFWRAEHERRGYQEVSTPVLNSSELWETSGHWEHYKDNMFVVSAGEHVSYGAKPMNCPNAMLVYNLKTRSYRDLPLRLSDCGILHRRERSGTLHGLLRVQEFVQDDAHIFVAEEQIEDEFGRVLELTDLFYRVFGLTYSFRFGTRPDDFIGDPEAWNAAEAALLRPMERYVGRSKFTIAEGDGAFYGPKIDILMEDALGRSWQTGTIQLDFQLPRRFGCEYVASDGARKTPAVIHRAIYGSLERFIGILLEHTAGALPIWLAPVQVAIVPVTDDQSPYAHTVARRLTDAGLRVEVDATRDRMQAKIRAAQLQKVPYMLVVGKREAEAGIVAVRVRSGRDLGAMPIAGFLDLALPRVASRSLYLDDVEEAAANAETDR